MKIGLQFRTVALVGLALLFGAAVAHAHPHVWVVAKSEIVYAPDGSIKAINYAWTFDEMFSAFATQGLDKNNDGKLSRDELSELATINVTSLKEFDYFTIGKSGGKPMAFGEPLDYWIDADDNKILTLHFTLPVKSEPPKGNVTIDVYDPTYFIAFTLADGEPVKLNGAPAGCAVEVQKPNESSSSSSSAPPEAFFNSSNGYGSMFANHIAVRCR